MTCKEFIRLVDSLEGRTNGELAACINHYSTCLKCREEIDGSKEEFERTATPEQILESVLYGAARRIEANQDPEFLETIKDNPYGEFHA